MPVIPKHESMIQYLKSHLTNNKARGMAAEMAIGEELQLMGKKAGQKLLEGAWIFSPRYKFYVRFCCFVMPNLYEDHKELQQAIKMLERDRTWQTLATFLTTSHIGITVSGAITSDTTVQIEQIEWVTFSYEDEQLVRRYDDEPFTLWEQKGYGRASKGKAWGQDVEARYYDASSDSLTGLTLRQAFLESYMKTTLRKSFGETYDVDGFVVSFSGRVLPIEIKEKSSTKNGEFGVDAGRILMLLRLCLMTDSNALYIIREVDESENRNLIGWKYITLADLVMKCRWNLQGGGRGMTGGSTQTIMMPGELFQTLSDANFAEDWLAEHGSLQKSVQTTGQQLAGELSHYLLGS